MSEISNKHGKVLPNIVDPLLENRREFIRGKSKPGRKMTDTEYMNHLGLERSKYYRLKNGTGDLWVSDLMYMIKQSGKTSEFWLRDYPFMFAGVEDQTEKIASLQERIKEKEEMISLLKDKVSMLQDKLT